MINIEDLKETDVGRTVKYRATPTFQYEYGTITSWNNEYIFVDYKGSGNGTPTRGKNLEFDDNITLKITRDGRLIASPKDTNSVG